MTLAELLLPGVLRKLATATVATFATHGKFGAELSQVSQLSQAVEEGTDACSPVASVATVAVAVTAETISRACRLAGIAPENLPPDLYDDLLAMEGDARYLAHVIREEAHWHGWNGSTARVDYAPGGRFYPADAWSVLHTTEPGSTAPPPTSKTLSVSES